MKDNDILISISHVLRVIIERSAEKDILSLTKDQIWTSEFAFRLILLIASCEKLKPQIIHDLLVTSMILFSRIVSPTVLSSEIEM